MNAYYPPTRAELAEKYPAEPQLIDREEFMDTLECLPPCKWSKADGLEVFHLSELAYDNVALWCAWDRTRNVGWKFYADTDLTRNDIVRLLEGVRS